MGIGIAFALDLLLPALARSSIGAVVALRAVQGMFLGVIWPALYVLVEDWLPRQEKTRMFAFISAGLFFRGGNF